LDKSCCKLKVKTALVPLSFKLNEAASNALSNKLSGKTVSVAFQLAFTFQLTVSPVKNIFWTASFLSKQFDSYPWIYFLPEPFDSKLV